MTRDYVGEALAERAPPPARGEADEAHHTADDTQNSQNSYPPRPWPVLHADALHGIAGEVVRYLPSTVWSHGDLVGAGFERHNGDYEAGWHPGQTDTLEMIARNVDDIRERVVAGEELGDVVNDVADADVPIYTHQRWQVFVDLCAYEEDVSELYQGSDMTDMAAVALFMIAERLLYALVEEAIEDAS